MSDYKDAAMAAEMQQHWLQNCKTGYRDAVPATNMQPRDSAPATHLYGDWSVKFKKVKTPKSGKKCIKIKELGVRGRL